MRLLTIMRKEWDDAKNNAASSAPEVMELVAEGEGNGTAVKEEWISEAIQLFGEELVTIKEDLNMKELPDMNNMNQMMKQVKKMQEQMMKAQEELGTKMIEGTAGGGVVTCIINGHKKVLKASQLNPKLLIRMMSKCCKILYLRQ